MFCVLVDYGGFHHSKILVQKNIKQEKTCRRFMSGLAALHVASQVWLIHSVPGNVLARMRNFVACNAR